MLHISIYSVGILTGLLISLLTQIIISLYAKRKMNKVASDILTGLSSFKKTDPPKDSPVDSAIFDENNPKCKKWTELVNARKIKENEAPKPNNIIKGERE